MKKYEMIDMLQRNNLVRATCDIEKFSKREIAERMDCYISASDYVSQARFQAACAWKRENREQI